MSREQDRLFIRNFIAVLAGLVGVTLVLIIAVTIAFDESQEGPTAVERERAAQRLAPAGQVRVAPIQAQEPAAPAAGSAASAEPPAQPPAREQTTTQPVPDSPAAPGETAADAAAAERSADSATPPDGSQGQPDTSTAAEAAEDTSESGAGGNGGAEQTPAEPAGEGAAQPAPEASAPTAPPTEDLAAGKALAEGMCNVCHANRFLNSPQIGDLSAWKPRLERDLATMVRHVQEGYGNMPPQGAFGTTEEIRKAILWMVEEETGLEVKR